MEEEIFKLAKDNKEMAVKKDESFVNEDMIKKIQKLET